MQTSPKSKTVGLVLSVLCVLMMGGVTLFIWFGMVKPYAEGLERPRVPLLKKGHDLRLGDQNIGGDFTVKSRTANGVELPSVYRGNSDGSGASIRFRNSLATRTIEEGYPLLLDVVVSKLNTISSNSG